MHFQTDKGDLDVEFQTLTIAGWTARDIKAVQHHIDELAAIGIAPPSQTPLYYRVGHNLLTQDQQIEVLGTDSSGEVEPLVVKAAGQFWLGLGSDHTDRKLEAVSVAASKQVCPKPVARDLWSWDSIAQHLDQMELRSEILENGGWVPYQSGTMAAIRPLRNLIDASDMRENSAMMCGTLAAIGGVRPASQFRATLIDPVLERKISLSYTTNALPVIA